MKIKKYIYGVVLGALSLTYASCYNSDKEFPDYEGGTTAYFAYQFPVRTVILGNDIYDNTLDNAHKIHIWSTMGGAYNGRDAFVEIAVDESLCENLHFVDEGGNPIKEVSPMPKDYYTLASNTIPYRGDLRGYVEVQLTDKFFADEKSIENTYVIPLLMKSVVGIDSILRGEPRIGHNPARQNYVDSEWYKYPRDFVLYCVKYMNPWQGKYIRRGVDEVTEGTTTNTIIRKDFSLINSDPERYTENPVNQYDEVCSITTKNMKQAIFPISIKTSNGSEKCSLILTFDGNKCVISSANPDEYTVTGSGEFIEKGTTKAEYKDYQWGGTDVNPTPRDILRLAYDLEFKHKPIKSSTKDTLVIRDRESNKREFFSPKYVK